MRDLQAHRQYYFPTTCGIRYRGGAGLLQPSHITSNNKVSPQMRREIVVKSLSRSVQGAKFGRGFVLF